MGGHAFDPEGLNTPRMPLNIYQQVKNRITAILSEHFTRVGTPVEGPAKTDYGDIDILVCDPINPQATKPEYIASLIGTKHYKQIPGNDTINLAVPYPSTNSDRPDEKYIQVDVCIVSTLAQYQWLLFLHSHGDLWMILGHSLRRYGLTCTPSGFYLHIPEIEGQNRNLGRVKITDRPGDVLGYLGLDEERYWKGFEGWDDLLEFVGGL